MIVFSDVVYELQQKNSDVDKINLLQTFLENASTEDKIVAISLLLGKKPKRIIDTAKLKALVSDTLQVPDWLVMECHQLVGDLAETISLLLPLNENLESTTLHHWFLECNSHQKKTEQEINNFIATSWRLLTPKELYVFNKLILGNFKADIDEKIIVQVLAEIYGKDFTEVSILLKSEWSAFTHTLEDVMQSNTIATLSKPYHFTKSENITQIQNTISNYHDWWVEYKYEGIRCQIVKRQGQIFIWDKNYNLLNDKLKTLIASLIKIQHDFVLDTVIMGVQAGKSIPVQPFFYTKKSVDFAKEGIQWMIIAFDIMEWNTNEFAHLPLDERKIQLENLVQKMIMDDESISISIPEKIKVKDIQHLNTLKENARNQNADGLLLKHQNHGREDVSTFWYKWKLDPYTILVVLMYAQKGEGKYTNIFSDYTFGIMEGSKLISIAKTNEGLTEEEILELDSFVKSNTIEKFGPVRTVEPQLVFELAFDSLNISKRHKSNLLLIGAHIVRWRRDLMIDEASQLSYLKGLLK
jgi:DNA ligase 1